MGAEFCRAFVVERLHSLMASVVIMIYLEGYSFPHKFDLLFTRVPRYSGMRVGDGVCKLYFLHCHYLIDYIPFV